MEAIIAAISAAILGHLGMKLLNSNARLNGAEFVLLCIVSFIFVIYCGQLLWNGATALRAQFGLPTYPEIFYLVYSPWELSLCPVLIGAAVYSFFVLLLRVRYWPEHFSEEERYDWILRKIRAYRNTMFVLAVVEMAYSATRWAQWWFNS